MADPVLYPEEVVRKMLAVAYKAGFEGPLELIDDCCRGIIMNNSSVNESDLELMKYMQERDKRKQEDGARNARSSSNKKQNAPAYFQDEVQ